MDMDAKKIFDVSGKTIIVTGAAGLLGIEYAKGLSQVGANVVLADINFKKCKEICIELAVNSEEFYETKKYTEIGIEDLDNSKIKSILLVLLQTFIQVIGR